MLTFVVAGGGFSGTEVAAALNDCVRRTVGDYRSLRREEIRVVLVHSGKQVLERELTARAGAVCDAGAGRAGDRAGVGGAVGGGEPTERGAGRRAADLDADADLDGAVLAESDRGADGVGDDEGAVGVRGDDGCEGVRRTCGRSGDCAQIPMRDGSASPPTAQHAIREAKVLAANIVASESGGRRKSFAFTGLGKLGALGRRRAVAELPGGVTVEGRLAWLMWRCIYWAKLPGASRKAKVAVSWLSDLVLPAHPVPLNLGGGRGARQAHYEPGEVVFEEGEVGESLFMILSGTVEVSKHVGGETRQIGTLGAGEYFGEMALLGSRTRSASTRAATALDLLVLPSV